MPCLTSRTASETVAGIEAAGSKGASFIVDVTNPEAVMASAGEVEAALGSADILVNNAGIYPNQMFDGMTSRTGGGCSPSMSSRCF